MRHAYIIIRPIKVQTPRIREARRRHVRADRRAVRMCSRVSITARIRCGCAARLVELPIPDEPVGGYL